jgi:hypothetical protein
MCMHACTFPPLLKVHCTNLGGQTMCCMQDITTHIRKLVRDDRVWGMLQQADSSLGAGLNLDPRLLHQLSQGGRNRNNTPRPQHQQPIAPAGQSSYPFPLVRPPFVPLVLLPSRAHFWLCVCVWSSLWLKPMGPAGFCFTTST